METLPESQSSLPSSSADDPGAEQRKADHIELAGTIDHADLVAQSNCYYDWEGACEDYWYANLRRSIYIEDNLFSLSNYGVKINDLYDPSVERARVYYNPR